MILIDFNQLILCTLLSNLKNLDLDLNSARHIALTSIAYYRKKFKKEYGEVVICNDGTNYWRKDLFPFYKAHRKDQRDKSGYDWKLIFQILNELVQEFKLNLPYKILHLPKIEADDCIAILCKNYRDENHLIVSGDEDYIQLQIYSNVSQYSPRKKKFIKSLDPVRDLYIKILEGDRSDGIPNVLSEDDSIFKKKRQTTLSNKAKNDIFLLQDQNILAKYVRNRKLIDFNDIPQEIENEILSAYNNFTPSQRSDLINYFIKSELKGLFNILGDF